MPNNKENGGVNLDGMDLPEGYDLRVAYKQFRYALINGRKLTKKEQIKKDLKFAMESDPLPGMKSPIKEK